MQHGRPTVATVDLEALRANAALAQRLAGARDLIAVVKADAYGHGAVPVARALLEAGCRRLAVLSVGEAATLREAAVAVPILVLGGVHDLREAERAASLRVTPVLHDREDLARVAEAARRIGSRVRVQVEVDTGMRRMGVALEDAELLFAEVAAEGAVEFEGAFTHFACADEPDPRESLEQLARFRRVLGAAKQRGVSPPIIHAENSAGLLSAARLADALPEATAVRPGLMLYGVLPAAHLEADLRPVMTLRTRVVAVRDLRPGEAVGYGATYRAPADGGTIRIATLPIGYADGVPCSTGNRGRVWLAGARRPIVGRVSMDYTGVEVGRAPVEVGDEAVIFGVSEAGALRVEDAARAADTIAYELLVRVGERVPREFVG